MRFQVPQIGAFRDWKRRKEVETEETANKALVLIVTCLSLQFATFRLCLSICTVCALVCECVCVCVAMVDHFYFSLYCRLLSCDYFSFVGFRSLTFVVERFN
jgi:hypothetical protein